MARMILLFTGGLVLLGLMFSHMGGSYGEGGSIADSDAGMGSPAELSVQGMRPSAMKPPLLPLILRCCQW
jgi:hypothetical protein